MGAAILLLLADTLINHQPPILILARIDWNVLVLFFGLFRLARRSELHRHSSPDLVRPIFAPPFHVFPSRMALHLDTVSFTNIGSLFVFSTFALLGSNVFSNVPLTLLVLEQIPRTGDHLSMILYLAFVKTIAGNLTLFGSVANLIVAQKALASSLKYRFGFWTYLKFGFPTTIVLTCVGVFILYGLLQVVH